MNWDALGAIAELVGAAGVILTLIYLSRQISQNTRQLTGSAIVAVHEYQRSMTEELCNNPELWQIVRKSNADWDVLTPEEQADASLWNIKESGYWEMCYQLKKQGSLDEGVYLAREKYYLTVFQSPGRRKWWDQNSLLLSDEFYEKMTEKLNSQGSDTFAEAHPHFFNGEA